MWKELIMTWFKVLSQHLAEGTDNHETRQYSLSTGHDLNLGPPEYEEVITTQLQHSLLSWYFQLLCSVVIVPVQTDTQLWIKKKLVQWITLYGMRNEMEKAEKWSEGRYKLSEGYKYHTIRIVCFAYLTQYHCFNACKNTKSNFF
jgi:hypothetical protein